MAKTRSRTKQAARGTRGSRNARPRKRQPQSRKNISARIPEGDRDDTMTPPLEDQLGSTSPQIGSAPIDLEPNQGIHLQTWAEQPTTLHVENTSNYVGEISLRWGTHSEEIDRCDPGATDLFRNFGGIPVHITNTGNVSLRVSAV